MEKKDIIFIDTSIFEANNFLEGRRINEILKLSENDIVRIVIPRLTYDEIINRIKKNINTAHRKFKNYRNDIRILRNIPTIKGQFNPFKKDDAKKELILELDKKFSSAKITIIEYSSIDIEEIFHSYFNQVFPFSQGKKDEFPDAFALKIIENWCKKEKVTVKVFSNDNDINRYKGEHLVTGQSFNVYLDSKLIEIAKEKELLKKIKNAIEKYKVKIVSDVERWVESEIDDISLYYDYCNNMEIYDIEINEIIINLETNQITSVDDEYITIQIKTSINFKVDLTIDDEDYMIKDEDTKEWIFLESTIVTVDETRLISIDILFYLEDNEIIEYDIESFNDGQELRI